MSSNRSSTREIAGAPHWYLREDKDQLRSIFCAMEKKLSLPMPANSRMIRQFVGSIFRRGIMCYDPFVDFSIVTVCKDRTQGKEQDDFEHELRLCLTTWDSKDGLPIDVEEIDTEPTVRFSLGRTLPAAGSSGIASLGNSPALTPADLVTAPPAGSPVKYYPELLCLPRYPRARPADIEYETKQAVSSAQNKDRFCIRVRESSEPSSITYTYACGMPSRSLSAGTTGSNSSLEEELVWLPKFSTGATSTSDGAPWRAPSKGDDEEEEDSSDDDPYDPNDFPSQSPPSVRHLEDEEIFDD